MSAPVEPCDGAAADRRANHARAVEKLNAHMVARLIKTLQSLAHEPCAAEKACRFFLTWDGLSPLPPLRPDIDKLRAQELIGSSVVTNIDANCSDGSVDNVSRGAVETTPSMQPLSSPPPDRESFFRHLLSGVERLFSVAVVRRPGDVVISNHPDRFRLDFLKRLIRDPHASRDSIGGQFVSLCECERDERYREVLQRHFSHEDSPEWREWRRMMTCTLCCPKRAAERNAVAPPDVHDRVAEGMSRAGREARARG